MCVYESCYYVKCEPWYITVGLFMCMQLLNIYVVCSYMCVMTPVMIISVDYGKIVCLFMHMQSAGTKTPPYRYLGCSCLSEVIIE